MFIDEEVEKKIDELYKLTLPGQQGVYSQRLRDTLNPELNASVLYIAKFTVLKEYNKQEINDPSMENEIKHKIVDKYRSDLNTLIGSS